MHLAGVCEFEEEMKRVVQTICKSSSSSFSSFSLSLRFSPSGFELILLVISRRENNGASLLEEGLDVPIPVNVDNLAVEVTLVLRYAVGIWRKETGRENNDGLSRGYHVERMLRIKKGWRGKYWNSKVWHFICSGVDIQNLWVSPCYRKTL